MRHASVSAYWTAACAVAVLALAGIISSNAGASAGTLDDVRKRGTLRCGVSEGLPGFSSQGKDKRWTGFDVDYCRALAAAVFDDPEKVDFVPLSATARFDALAEKKIDVLSRNTTWTFERDVALGLEFVGVSYYDGQGFLTRQSNGVSSALQLVGARVCVLDGTTSETNVQRYFADNKVRVTIESFQVREELVKAYDAEKCDAYSADTSGLASDRQRLSEPDAHVLLPEVISKEPLGPVVRQDDRQWIEIGRWVLYLLINAEEVGWTKVAAESGSQEQPIVVSEAASRKLGLDTQWPVFVIKAVGNYGEIFMRNVGASSPLELPRGVNALWARGGILYAPPLR
jgi:general L-amino acid transport system substrate-binding protein